MARRDSSDERWQELKKEIRKRDKTCRLIKKLTAREAFTLMKHAPSAQLQKTDVAHIFGVGNFPSMCYDAANCVLLNRFSHECLDSCRDPTSGDSISQEERDLWWMRIVGEETFKKLEKRAFRKEKEDLYGR